MSEGKTASNEGQGPYIDEAVILGAEKQSKNTGKPVITILDAAQKTAEQNEDLFMTRVYKKIIRKLFGN